MNSNPSSNLSQDKDGMTSSFKGRKVSSSKGSKSKSDMSLVQRERNNGQTLKAVLGTNAFDEEFTGVKALRKKKKTKGNILKREGSFQLSNSAGDFSEHGQRTKPFDAESVLTQFSGPTNKYRGKNSPPKGKLRKMKSSQSFSSLGVRSRSFSNALKKSLADLSEQVLIKKNSLSTAEENASRVANAEADKMISDVFVRSLLRSEVPEMSEKFFFGGYKYDDMNCFNKDQQYFIDFYRDAFEELQLSPVFANDQVLLERFLRLVARNYRDEKVVPFHNFRHGFSVGQVAVIFIMRNYFLKKFFDKRTLFTFIIACIVHDVDHPGNDNFYEMVSNSDRSKMHGNVATLENHHSHKLIQLIKNDGENNIFKYLDSETQDYVFEQVCDLILSTDMGQHKNKLEILKEFKSLGTLMGERNTSDQLELLGCIIHACDLSGQCDSFEVAEKWEENIHYEMQRQFKMLVKKKLKLPEHMKRFHLTGKKGLEARYKSQAGFINFLLVPYWTEVVRLIPEMSDFLENLKRNGKLFAEKAANIGKPELVV